MKIWRPIVNFSLVAIVCVPALAQGRPDFIRGSVSLEGKYVMLTPGTTFEGRIDQTIGSSVSHAGQSFAVTLSAPVLLNGADVVIPAGSQVLGEVVEAVPSSQLPHRKDEPIPNGILRIQLTSLKTVEGATYPLVAALTYDHDRGFGVALVGTAESFQPKKKSVTSGNAPSNQPLANSASRGMSDRTRAQALPWRNMGDNAADLNYSSYDYSRFANSPGMQIYNNNGDNNNQNNNGNGSDQGGNLYNGTRNVSDRTRAQAHAIDRDAYMNANSGNGPDGKKKQKQSSGIESLVKRHHDLFIDSGSPLTMKLQAPLKIGFNPPAAPPSEVSHPAEEMMSQPQGLGESSPASALSAPPPPEGEFAKPQVPPVEKVARPQALSTPPVGQAAKPAPPVGQVAQPVSPVGQVAKPAPPVIPQANAATAGPANNGGQSVNKQSDSSLLPFLGPGVESSSSSSSTSKKTSSESSSHSSTTTIPTQPGTDSQF